jgi:uncharacterized protein with NRDE domain
VCTVVCRWSSGVPLQILAVRDELVSRAFDGPASWWPDHPGVVGGRDRLAGGSWCVSDVTSGVTALVLNRIERRTGTPSRGVLPLAAVEHGRDWARHVEYRGMASFNLVLAQPSGGVAWTWDGETLGEVELAGGMHVITSRGVDPDDDKTRRFAPALADRDWFDVITSCVPEDDLSALVVRHPVGEDVYATVFGQLITATPGALTIRSSRTPWMADTWTSQRWP